MAFRPKLHTSREIGLDFTELFGALGDELYVTGHYTAGPRDTSDSDAIGLVREYHAYHASKGWGGIAYHFCITAKGNIICCRPTALKGAHTGGANSNNLGVMMHGTAGDKPTRAQARAYRWLLKNAHTRKLPPRHRTDRDLMTAKRFGHKEWPNNPTSCPDLFLKLYKTRFR
jgi:hypothetical protein